MDYGLIDGLWIYSPHQGQQLSSLQKEYTNMNDKNIKTQLISWLILRVHLLTPFVWQDNCIYLNVLISETCFAQQREQTFSDSASGFIAHFLH